MKIRTHLLCRKCGADWDHTAGTIETVCPYCGATKDARDRSTEARAYKKAKERKRNLKTWYAQKENRLARSRKSYALLRRRVFFKITGSIHPQCVRCGCDDYRFLEINHKHGGGGKEIKTRAGRFYLNVALGRRSVSDLELLCRACNAVHFLEQRHGLQETGLVVTWKKTGP